MVSHVRLRGLVNAGTFFITTIAAEYEFFAEIKAAGLTRKNFTLNYLWRLYLTFNQLRKRGYRVRLVGPFRQAPLVIEGGPR